MRGHAVIIVNEKAVAGSKFKERKGAPLDADNLQRAFCTKLKFSWLNQGNDSRDLPKSKWIHSKKRTPPNCGCITCKIKNTDHSDSECFLLVISSHGREVGGQPQVRFSDGKRVTLSEIVNTLNDKNCPSLEGKPRIVILQACRLNPDLPEDQREDRGYEVLISGMNDAGINGRHSENEDDEHPQTSGNEYGQDDQLVQEYNDGATGGANQDWTDVSSSSEESDGDNDEEKAKASLLDIPKNFLIVLPSAAGKRSKRSTTKGSWLIDGLCKVIDEHQFENNHSMDFLKILTKAVGRVAINRESKREKFKNAPCIIHRLIEPLVFKDVSSESESGPTGTPAL